jgi:putative flippase GtrA
MPNLLLAEKFSFLVVGGSAALAFIAIAQALHWSGVSLAVATVVAYLVCIPLAYLGQRYITFHSSRRHPVAFARYVATQALGLTLATAMVLLASSAGLPSLVALVLADAVASIQTYVLQKYWVY